MGEFSIKNTGSQAVWEASGPFKPGSSDRISDSGVTILSRLAKPVIRTKNRERTIILPRSLRHMLPF